MKEEKENKKRWVEKHGFINNVWKLSNQHKYIPNYVNLTPSQPPVNYNFREIHKDKWVGNKNFYV
jgi:hypothetical protein